METQSNIEALAKQALSMAEKNTILRKIAAHLPGRVWLEAKEKAGYGVAVTAAELSDPAVDEAWLRFVASGCPSARESSLEAALRSLLTDVESFDKSGTFANLRSYDTARKLLEPSSH